MSKEYQIELEDELASLRKELADMKRADWKVAHIKDLEEQLTERRDRVDDLDKELAEAKAEIDKMEWDLIARDKATADMLESRNAALKAANARIAELEHSCAVLNHVYKETEARAERAEAERDALREALERIIRADQWHDWNCTSQDTCHDGRSAKIARAALAATVTVEKC